MSLKIGKFLTIKRLRTGLSQDEVAKEMGLSRSSIANIEADRQNLLLHQIVKLSYILCFSLTEIPDVELK